MYHRLAHVRKNLNDKDRWWVSIGETPLFYLAVLYGRGSDGKVTCLNSTVHAVLKSDYEVGDAVKVAATKTEPADDDASDLL